MGAEPLAQPTIRKSCALWTPAILEAPPSDAQTPVRLRRGYGQGLTQMAADRANDIANDQTTAA